MTARLEQFVDTCMLYIQKELEQVELKTEEDLDQLRLTWFSILSGDMGAILLPEFKEKASRLRKMYEDAGTLFGINDPVAEKKLKKLLKDAIWSRAELLEKMKSGKAKKAFIEKWSKLRKLSLELLQLQEQVKKTKKKIQSLREEQI